MKGSRLLVCGAVLALHLGAQAGSYEDFFSALQRDDAPAMAALLQRGFDPDTLDPKGQPALSAAIRNASEQVAKLLLDQPALHIDALNAAGESALMLAALKGDLAWCQRLLDRGARIEQPGWSPLHYAATGPNSRVVELLLSRGVAVDAESPNRSTPLMMAARYGSEASVELLLAHGADAARRNDRELRAAEFARLAGREALAVRLEQRYR